MKRIIEKISFALMAAGFLMPNYVLAAGKHSKAMVKHHGIVHHYFWPLICVSVLVINVIVEFVRKNLKPLA
ncbi:MAG: hypothetical protein LBN08_06550 [Lactobacillales bacterium]|jgi:hypothetical protein|nr:hypothetical protein [Lactobacillales bacterium]